MAQVTRQEFDRLKGLVDNLIFQLMPIGLTGEVSIPESAFQLGAILRKLQRFKGLYWFNSQWLPADGSLMKSYVSGSGAVSADFESYILTTGTTLNSYSKMIKYDQGVALGWPTWDKKRYFLATVYYGQSTSQIIHIATGRSSETLSANTARHVGFKVIDGTLYGTVGDGTNESTLTIGTLSSPMTIECIFKPASECRFYKDGVDVGILTTSLPSGAGVDSSENYLLGASIYNTVAETRTVYLRHIRVYQEE